VREILHSQRTGPALLPVDGCGECCAALAEVLLERTDATTGNTTSREAAPCSIALVAEAGEYESETWASEDSLEGVEL